MQNWEEVRVNVDTCYRAIHPSIHPFIVGTSITIISSLFLPQEEEKGYCTGKDDLEHAQKVCSEIGIPLQTVRSPLFD